MNIYLVIEKKQKKGYVAVARYQLRTIRRTFRVTGKSLKELHQNVVNQVNTNCKTLPMRISIRHIPVNSGYGKFITGVIPALEKIRGG